MKKILFIISFILMSVITYSQDTFQLEKVETLRYTKTGWKVSTTKNIAEYHLTIGENYIDFVGTKFIYGIFSDEYENNDATGTSSIWKAVDYNNKPCELQVTFLHDYRNKFWITVYYYALDLAIRWTVKVDISTKL